MCVCDAAAQRLRAAFFRCSDVSPDHPARQCLTACDVARLRDTLFSRSEWKAGAYTRTLLLKGESFNVMLLCWAPGCASPVHGHSCVDTHVHSNCACPQSNLEADDKGGEAPVASEAVLPLLAGFMLILEGQLAETVYGEDAVSADGKSVQARLGKTQLHGAGTLAYINDSVGLHKVANTTGGRAVSLHVDLGAAGVHLVEDLVKERRLARSTPAAGETFERQT